MDAAGKFDYLVEVFPLDPELELAGSVPSVIPTSKVVTMTARIGQGFSACAARVKKTARKTLARRRRMDALSGEDSKGYSARLPA